MHSEITRDIVAESKYNFLKLICETSFLLKKNLIKNRKKQLSMSESNCSYSANTASSTD